jgi:hypothetical protein
VKDILEYTEQAISLLGGEMPSIVYLPPDIRQRKTRLTTDGIITNNPYGSKEITDRVIAADPLGFLLAVMNGQPIPSFRVKRPGSKPIDEPAPAKDGSKRGRRPRAPQVSSQLDTENGVEVYADWYTPTMADRERVAQYLVSNFAPIIKRADRAKGTGPDEGADPYDRLLAQRAKEAEGGNQ